MHMQATTGGKLNKLIENMVGDVSGGGGCY